MLNVNTANWLYDLSISYCCPKVPRQYAQAIADTFRAILTEIALCTGCKLGQLNCISGEDKQRMLSWNPEKPCSHKSCMHHMVEFMVQSIPDAEAVCAWDGSLTYSELDELSSMVAKKLISAGVRLGDYVPFAFEKSLWTVVATLAILKAGGAFVPLDPANPVARVEEILSDTNAAVVVTSHSFEPLFKSLGKNVVVVSAQTVHLQQDNETGEMRLPAVSPQDPVFVLFTSGSTGQPKGMIHEHGAFCTYIISHGEAMAYKGARVLQFSAYTWDAAILDIFTTLTFGGCVCIPSEEDRVNNVTRVINSMKVDYALLTPSFASLIDPNEVPGLRTLALAGESLKQENIRQWAEKVRLISAYGPAEVGICLLMCREGSKARAEAVGYPLGNSSCWLVDPDDHDRLVPVGAVGELVVAGPSLARGYLSNEAKTRASFVTNPAWANAMGLKDWRFYKTGDLLRYNVDAFDGLYDFIRRKDTQVKLHGQRIEPGEVEHHVANIPGVAASIVVQPKQGCFSDELVAVVQMRGSMYPRTSNENISIDGSQTFSLENVKDHLSKHLPSYMVPTACLVITSMPFASSYKIDRRSVETWLASMVSRPVKILTTTMANLKSSPLNAKEITANAISVKVAEFMAQKDEFQELMLGGHDFLLQNAGLDSIQIVSLSMFLQRTYGLKIPMNTLMSSRTKVRDLACLIDRNLPQLVASGTAGHINILDECRMQSAELFRDIEAQSVKPNLERQVTIQNIFLTGASGYLGLGILQNLMGWPDIHVFVLVRCSTESEGLERIIHGARKTGWWQQEIYGSRIHVWPGDLRESNLGLTSEQLQCLRGTSHGHCPIHAVIHNGAKVHYSLDYEALKATNVHPTVELLKITAGAANLSTFAYVSGGRKPSLAEESESLGAIQTGQSNGYTQSKWVSESVVKSCFGHASFQTKCLRVINPGYIIGSSENAIANQTDFIWRLIAGCLEIKAYNADEKRHWLFISDVEKVSQVIVESVLDSSSKSNASSSTGQVLDGLHFDDLWFLLQHDSGYELNPLPHDQWLQRLETAIMARGEAHLLFPFVHHLEKDGGHIGAKEIPPPDAAASVRVKEAIRRNVQQLVGVGFLPPPPPPVPPPSLQITTQVLCEPAPAQEISVTADSAEGDSKRQRCV